MPDQVLLAMIMLLGDPQDAVAVHAAPDGRERIAVAKVHAAELALERRRDVGDATREFRIDQSLHDLKAAQVLLPVGYLTECTAFLLQVLGGEEGDLGRRDFYALPILLRSCPGLVEEATLTLRLGQAEHAPLRRNQHLPDRLVD